MHEVSVNTALSMQAIRTQKTENTVLKPNSAAASAQARYKLLHLPLTPLELWLYSYIFHRLFPHQML